MAERSCACCYDTEFDEKTARDQVRDYRRNGPPKATRLLADALAGHDLAGMTVLDIGAGVGALHQDLLARGAASAVDVDASHPYLESAREEAERLGLTDRVRFEYGDFVEIAEDIGPADLVALDRSVCCYPDMVRLVGLAAQRTRRRLGLVLPRDLGLVRFGIAVLNVGQWIKRSPFRVYAHRHVEIDGVARAAGLVEELRRTTGMWTVIVYARPAPDPSAAPVT